MRNALAVLGLVEEETHLREVMGARAWVGTPDQGFIDAGSVFGLDHRHVRDGDIELLRNETSAGHPCIVDWRHGQHYVCVLSVTDRHVFFVDSNPRDTEIIRLLSHARFLELWWDSNDPEDRHHAVHIFALKSPALR